MCSSNAYKMASVPSACESAVGMMFGYRSYSQHHTSAANAVTGARNGFGRWTMPNSSAATNMPRRRDVAQDHCLQHPLLRASPHEESSQAAEEVPSIVQRADRRAGRDDHQRERQCNRDAARESRQQRTRRKAPAAVACVVPDRRHHDNGARDINPSAVCVPFHEPDVPEDRGEDYGRKRHDQRPPSRTESGALPRKSPPSRAVSTSRVGAAGARRALRNCKEWDLSLVRPRLLKD
jgi:hypothetical protein